MSNLLSGLIGAIVGAALGFIGAALATAAKGETPRRECVMEEIPDLLFFIYRCSECGGTLFTKER